MVDKEKVFKGLNLCIDDAMNCDQCPYVNSDSGCVEMIMDALALLKEWEERVQSCLKCEEYRMFHGTVLVSPVIREDGTRWRDPFDLTGTWLYRPDVDTWYCTPDDGGMTKSWVPAILSNFRIHY